MLRSFDYAAGSWRARRDPGGSRSAAGPRPHAPPSSTATPRAPGTTRAPSAPSSPRSSSTRPSTRWSTRPRNRPGWLTIPGAWPPSAQRAHRQRNRDAPTDDPATVTAPQAASWRRPRGTAPGTRPSRRRAWCSGLLPTDAPTTARVLGAHPHDGGVTVRVLRPLAERRQGRAARRLHRGLHPRVRRHLGRGAAAAQVVRLPAARSPTTTGATTADDPYRFLPTLGEVDLHLIGEGRHEQLWKVLGAHVRDFAGAIGPVTGTSFAVWAPNARARPASSATSTTGTAATTRCAASARPACGSCSSPASARAPATSSRSSAGTGAGGRRPTRWPAPPRCRRRPPRVVTASTYAWGDDDWMRQRAAARPAQRRR